MREEAQYLAHEMSTTQLSAPTGRLTPMQSSSAAVLCIVCRFAPYVCITRPCNKHCLRRLQVWLPIMSWYVDQRRQLEETVRKYSDPPSEHLLPDLPLHARYLYQIATSKPARL